MKLLVDAPSGLQSVVEVGEGGGYFNPAMVMWDERVDGALPAITLGGMVRSGGQLSFSQARMDLHTTALSAGQAAIKKESIKKALLQRDKLLVYLMYFYIKANEEPAGAPKDAKLLAIQTAIDSTLTFFNAPSIANSVDGDAEAAIHAVYLGIVTALYGADPGTFLAIKALDPL